MSRFVLVVASVIFAIAFWIYNKGVFKGRHTPAIAAWGVYVLVTFVNSTINLDLTADWVNTLVLFTDFAGCTLTFFVVLFKQKGKIQVDDTDKKIVLVSLVAVLIWKMTGVAWIGDVFNLVAYTFAFLPTLRNVLANPKNEPSLPWIMWVGALGLNVFALSVNPKTSWMDYISPVIYILYHGIIALLALRPQKIHLHDTM